MFDLDGVQRGLREFGLDGWLLYDFRGSNLLARRILGLDEKQPGSRRFFYFRTCSIVNMFILLSSRRVG